MYQADDESSKISLWEKANQSLPEKTDNEEATVADVIFIEKLESYIIRKVEESNAHQPRWGPRLSNVSFVVWKAKRNWGLVGRVDLIRAEVQ